MADIASASRSDEFVVSPAGAQSGIPGRHDPESAPAAGPRRWPQRPLITRNRDTAAIVDPPRDRRACAPRAMLSTARRTVFFRL